MGSSFSRDSSVLWTENSLQTAMRSPDPTRAERTADSQEMTNNKYSGVPTTTTPVRSRSEAAGAESTTRSSWRHRTRTTTTTMFFREAATGSAPAIRLRRFNRKSRGECVMTSKVGNDRRVRQRKRRRSIDLRRFDSTLEDLRRARRTLDDRMLVIDIAHQHSWDVARRYVEKERPIKNNNLREAIAESKKEADTKKDKQEKEKKRISRARFNRRSISPYRNRRSSLPYRSRRSRSPRERRRGYSPDRSSRYSRKNFGFDRDKAGCFTCGSLSHKARECPDKRSK